MVATLREHCPELLGASAPVVGVDVFPSAEGGAEAMAASFNVPFLGRVPLDTAITAASGKKAAQPARAPLPCWALIRPSPSHWVDAVCYLTVFA